MSLPHSILQQVDSLSEEARHELIRYLLGKDEDLDYYRMLEQSLLPEWDNDKDDIYNDYGTRRHRPHPLPICGCLVVQAPSRLCDF